MKIWINPDLKSAQQHSEIGGKKFYLVRAASARLLRFMPYLEAAFPETAARKGIIESDLQAVKGPDFDSWLVKKDSSLPITGHVEDRGGVYAVLKIAEDLATKNGMIGPTESRIAFAGDAFRDFFSQYTLCAGAPTPGADDDQLWQSIRIVGEKLGFQLDFGGFSVDAPDDGKRIDSGRCFVIGREMEEDLFMGYAVAALRLKVQITKLGKCVDEKHPLFVFLPCGNDLAAMGIAYGLKQVLGNLVHCFFVGEKTCFSDSVREMIPDVLSGQIVLGQSDSDGACAGKQGFEEMTFEDAKAFLHSEKGQTYLKKIGFCGAKSDITRLYWEM